MAHILKTAWQWLLCVFSPEPPLLAHTSTESRGTFRQKTRSLAPLNGWACAVEICHDGMLEDTNLLDGAQMTELWHINIAPTEKIGMGLNWAPPSEFVSSSIPTWQILTAHAQPFRGARDLAFCLKVPLDSLLVWASSEGSGETARMRRLAWTFAARIGDKYQIRLTRSNLFWPVYFSFRGYQVSCTYCQVSFTLYSFIQHVLPYSFHFTICRTHFEDLATANGAAESYVIHTETIAKDKLSMDQ